MRKFGEKFLVLNSRFFYRTKQDPYSFSAYEILGDESLRKNFDTYSTGNEKSKTRNPKKRRESQPQQEETIDRQSYRDHIFTEFDEFYKFKVRKVSQHGEDIHEELNLSFIESLEGCKKTVRYRRSCNCSDCQGTGAFSKDSFRRCFTCGGRGVVTHKTSRRFGEEITCDKCDGRGKVIYDHCEVCNGHGQVIQLHEESFTIPSGVYNGQKLRLEGKGNKGVSGGRPGDLYVKMIIETDEYYKFDDGEVHSECWLNPTQAIFGTTLEVSTLIGPQTIRVPPSTHDGTVYKLQECGIAKGKTQRRRGNHVLTFRIKVPASPSKELQELYRKLDSI